jgi:uncharacterized membrane protein YhaH (DUF805 family)
MFSIVKELPLMIAIISISWLIVVILTLKHLFKRTDITFATKLVWVLVGLIPVIGLLTYGAINFKKNKLILISIFVAIIISATSFWYFAIYEQKNNRTDVTNVKSVTKTAEELIKEFSTNEDAANKKYLQKENNVIEVSGEVEKSETDETGIVVFLKTNVDATNISCRLQDKTAIANGSQISVKGIFTGYIMGQVQLNECKVVSSAANITTNSTTTQNKVDSSAVKSTSLLVTDTTKKVVVAKTFKSSKGQIRFFSSTPAEDIEATNTQIVSSISDKGVVAFAALIKGFRFENELMQSHFNEEKYLNSDKFPKSEFKGTITNFNSVNLTKDGSYPVTAEGNLTLHGVTKNVTAKGTMVVSKGKIKLNSTFKLHVQDFNVDGSEAAEQLEITITADYN